jgi:hypothetical protein
LGKHHLKLKIGEDYSPVADDIILNKSRRNFAKNYTLKKRQGQLLIYGLPEGTAVFVDNKAAGMLPKLDVPVQYGVHVVKASKKGYYTYQRKVQVRTIKPVQIRIQLRPKDRAKAIIYSAMLPGMGQIYSGRKESGVLLSVATIGLWGMSYLYTNQYNDAKATYQQSVDAYLQNTDLAKMSVLYQEMQSNYDDMKQKYDYARLFLGLGIGIYLYNILDNILFFPDQNMKKFTVKPSVDKSKMALKLRINF